MLLDLSQLRMSVRGDADILLFCAYPQMNAEVQRILILGLQEDYTE